MPLAKGKTILLSVLIGAVVGLLVTTLLPSDSPYSTANSGNSGLYRLHEEMNARILYSLKDLDEFDATNSALITARRGGFENSMELKNFAERGGLVLVYGSPDYVIKLLKELDVSTGFKGYLHDIILNVGNPDYVIANTTSRCDGISGVVLGNPYALEGVFEGVFVHSSMFSYVDLNGNGFYDVGEPLGEFPLGVNITTGKGRIIIVFAESFLDNGILELNKQFLKCALGGRTTLIDQSEVARNPLELLRLVLYKQGVQVYITLVLVFALALVTYFVSWK